MPTPLQIASRPARVNLGAKSPRFTTKDLPRNAQVRTPGDKGYDGARHGADSRQGDLKAKLWARGAKKRPLLERLLDDKGYGRFNYGTTAVMTTGMLGTSAYANRNSKKQAANIRAGVGNKNGIVKMAKPRAMPGMPGVHQARGKVPDITTASAHPRFARAKAKFKDREARLANWASNDTNNLKLTLGGVAVGMPVVVAAGITGQKRIDEAKRDRARMVKAGRLQPTGAVVKSAATLLHGGRGWAISAGATGAAGLGSAETARRKGHQEASENLVASTIGGWAGQGAYQGGTYSLKHKGLLEERKAKLSRTQKDRNLKRAKKEHGAFTADMYRNYPKTRLDGKTPMPGWKVNRAAGWVGRGKLGQGLGTAATASGSLVGMRYVNEPKRGGSGRRKVKKSLYVRDKQTSLTGLATTGAGLALGAWGLGRSGMVGRALAHGVKQATRRQNLYALSALQTAQAAQGALRYGTAPGERALRQIRAVDRAVSRVPSAIRPEIALAAGTLLVGHSRPIRRDTYHPVNIRVRTAGGF